MARLLAVFLATLALAVPVAVTHDAQRADALAYGFSYSRGYVGIAHGWVIFTDNDLIHYGSRAAISAACSRLIGVPFSGAGCSKAAEQVWQAINWQGGKNHGVFIEIGLNGRRYVGRW